ncbi:Hydroxylamine oxidoreductase precursor [Aquisphaera giovannonii]|uniref:Hydroxylamine oxidoreductase n=1 Tax=Aquisphaera giovannonii TaxID=406548 RepID=A0A5B9W8W0_9BACT|nr:multiheme c-type cytochrome [Aquisphaera giovannonii]QEH37066.1 Hydroxylamine oxidoreductase precursor [Aquisphaera giovannonii]
MSFRGVFIAVVLSTALIVSAFVLQMKRPRIEVDRATPALVKASGKCADCHRHETSAIVHEFDMSKHNAAGVNCLDCHQPSKGQEPFDHKGFTITKKLSAANCIGCHPDQYRQYLESRHAAPSWAAVAGKEDFTAEQVAFAEKLHKGAVDRPPHELVKVEGMAAVNKGCRQCHDIGKPNKVDGTIGNCTACHARHVSSVALARLPETCGQCHMGPDHSQLEIYHESKHGVLFNAQRNRMNLDAPPSKLTTADMPVPTCATCHMSGLEGTETDKVRTTHNPSERLSYFLFAAVSDKRPHAEEGERNMRQVCTKCHTNPRILAFYKDAQRVVLSTNKIVNEAKAVVDGLRKDKLLTETPFDEAIEYVYFDLWHYGGRTAKHGAYMGGADFVQWHGYYEIVSKLAELKHQAEDIRKGHKPLPAGAKSEAAKAAGLDAITPALPAGGVHATAAPR